MGRGDAEMRASMDIACNTLRPTALGCSEAAQKSTEPTAVTRQSASPGLKVVRGKDWRWGEQDGGAGKVGEIFRDARVLPAGWCQVRWADDSVNDYRIGSGGNYDLAVHSDKPAGSKKDTPPPPDEKNVSLLVEMGFFLAAAVHALQVSGNNVTAAVEWMSDSSNSEMMRQFELKAEQEQLQAQARQDGGLQDERIWNSASIMEESADSGSGSTVSPAAHLSVADPYFEVLLLDGAAMPEMCIGLRGAGGHCIAVFSPDGQMQLAGDPTCQYEVTENSAKAKRSSATLEGVDVTVGLKVMLAEGYQDCGDAASGPLQEGMEGVIVEASREPGGRVRASTSMDSDRRWWYDRKALTFAASPATSKAVLSGSAEFQQGDRIAVGMVVGFNDEPTGEIRLVKNGCTVLRSCQVTRLPAEGAEAPAAAAGGDGLGLTPFVWIDSESPYDLVQFAPGGAATVGAFLLRDCHPAVVAARSLSIIAGAANALLESAPLPPALLLHRAGASPELSPAEWSESIHQSCALAGDLCARLPPGLAPPPAPADSADRAWPFSAYCALAAFMSVQTLAEGAVSVELLEKAFKSTCQPELRASFRELVSECESRAQAGEARDALLRERATVVARMSVLLLAALPVLSFAAAEEDAPFLAGAGRPPTLLLRQAARLLLKAHKDPVVKKLLARVTKQANDRPTVSLDRFRAQTSSATAENSVFGQVHAQIGRSHGARLFGDRWWRVSLQGESVSDGGGAFRDSLSTIAAELMSDATPLFIEAGGAAWGRCVVPNPSCHEAALYEFVGQLMGACLHSGERLALTLPPFVWRKLAGHPVGWADFAAFEPELAALYDRIARNAFPRAGGGGGEEAYSAEAFEDCIALDFTLALGVPVRTVELVPGGARVAVTLENRGDFVRLAREARMRAYDAQLRAMRAGLLGYCPEPALALWNSFELESAVCGEPDIPLDKFKESTRFQGTPPPRPNTCPYPTADRHLNATAHPPPPPPDAKPP
jgi:hypothetical protein